ncbi:hypothetical protein FRC11_012998 [Ceratobasidium sp. 423]|nr:hypothetical protein FRC11_012998 [Ceratobasidium sp. 423]
MLNFASLLEAVMSNTAPLNQDPPLVPHGTRRSHSQAGFDEGGRSVSSAEDAELSEAVHNKLTFAKTSMDYYGLEGRIMILSISLSSS